ncbi:hypothetical protein [Sphingomonas sp. URHD0057]|uniref:hypothetical protein n=1 Tax=Sphingomonas sp. URHD0057 TaxID=1380389 RepID=UPI00048F6245|nr:hypothetical protein [Sphingomonas sp. URHD0057]
MALFVFDFWLFAPGLVTFDSIRQYQEAVSGQYTDTHPPLLAAVWRALLPLSPDARPMLGLNLVLYWGSFAALGLYCVRSNPRRLAIAAVLAGLFPFLLSFSGVVWKDVTLAASWGLACALLLLSCSSRPDGMAFRVLWTASALLLIFGAAMRYNAAPAAIILAIALVQPLDVSRRLRFFIFALVAATVTLAVPISARLLQARDMAPFQNLVQWDLVGISYFSGQNAQADPPVALRPYSLDCYSPRVNRCPLVEFKNTGEAISRWRQAIEREPLAYLKHRVLAFGMLIRFGCKDCRPYVWESGSKDNPPGLGYRPNVVRKGLGYVMFQLGKTALARPYAWLVAALGMSLMLRGKGRNLDLNVLALIALSGAVYVLGYAIATVTDEFRYTYWLIYSVVLVGTASVFAVGVRWRDLMAWVAVPVLAAIAVDTLVQYVHPTDGIAPSMAAIY